MQPSIAVIVTVIATSLAAPCWNAQDKKPTAAQITKVVNDVEHRSSSTAGWTKASPLSELRIGSGVQTHEKSFAMIKFPDDSQVAVREQSVISIQGELSGTRILNRGVLVERGRAVFNIKKQDSGEFHFTSPGSRALIRSGEGAISFEPSTGRTVLTIATGVAEFSSTRPACKLVLVAGQTGIIDSTGCKTELNKK